MIPAEVLGRTIRCSRCATKFVVGAQFQLAEEPRPKADRRRAWDKDKFIAGLLAFFFGVFGLHEFYLERPGVGLLMLFFSMLGSALVVVGLTLSITIVWIVGAAIVCLVALAAIFDAILLWSMGNETFRVIYCKR